MIKSKEETYNLRISLNQKRRLSKIAFTIEEEQENNRILGTKLHKITLKDAFERCLKTEENLIKGVK